MTDIKAKLLAQADGLSLFAEEAEVVAKHFRPRFEACWQNSDLRDGVLALRLRHLVIERENEAKQWKREEAELREAASLIDR